MKILSLAAVLFLFLNSFSQLPIGLVDQIPNNKPKVFYNHTVTRVQGKQGTNCLFMNRTDLIELTKKKAEDEMWTETQLKNAVGNIRVTIAGGLFLFYTERATITAANGENFTCIVQDTTGKEIFRADIDYKIPDYDLSQNYEWFNCHIAYIPYTIELPFYVYLIDAYTEPTRHKFYIE